MSALPLSYRIQVCRPLFVSPNGKLSEILRNTDFDVYVSKDFHTQRYVIQYTRKGSLSTHMEPQGTESVNQEVINVGQSKAERGRGGSLN